MRIWLLTSESAHESAGGIARHVDDFSRQAGAAGHDVCVIGRAATACDLRPAPGVRVIGFESRAKRLGDSSTSREPDEHPAYPYNLIGEALGLSFETAERVLALLDESPPPDVIECHEHLALPYYLLQRKRLARTKLDGVPIVVRLDGSPPDRLRDGHAVCYRFPHWWTGELGQACLVMADSLVAADGSVAERTRAVLGPAFSHEITVVWDSLASTVAHFERTIAAHRPPDAYPALQTLRKHRFSAAAAASPFRRPESPGLLSVVIPFFNLGATVGETIASVRGSTHRPLEMILVDDGSTDAASVETLAALKHEASPDLIIVRSENQGVARTRNLGASQARGEYLCFLDADDCVEPRYFERCIAALKRYPSVDFVSSWVRYFGDARGIWPTFDASFPYLLGHNACPVFSVMRCSAFERAGGWNPAFEHGLEDHAFWISMLASGAIGVALPEPLVRYRVRAGSITRRLTPAQQVHLHERMSRLHPELFRAFGVELFNLQNANGPARLWDHPACEPPSGEGLRAASAGTGRRLMQRVQRTSLYRWYARKRNGPESA